MKALFIILLLITCSWQGTAQENSDKAITQNNKDHFSDPEYAPMGKLYASYFDAYLYILPHERRKDFLNWYYMGDKEIVQQRLRRFEGRLREIDAMTQVQLDSIMGITKEQKQDPLIDVNLTTLSELIFDDKLLSKMLNNEIIQLFRGHPVYVVTKQNTLSSGETIPVSIKIYFKETMNLLHRSVTINSH